MSDSKRLRILAVEDNPDTQLLLKYLLKSQFDIEVRQEVDAAIELVAEQQFDLLLLDINLGEERTGIHLLQQIRQQSGYEETPALALTAYAMPGDKERFAENGFDGYVSKPFTRKDLLEAIQAAIPSAGTP